MDQEKEITSTFPIVFESVETTPGGARRGSECVEVPRCMLSQIALRRYANAMAEGTVKHGPGNWLKGLPAANLLDHLYEHLARFLIGDGSEDHLGHALWNLATLVHFSETRPDLFQDLLFVDGFNRKKQLESMKEKATQYVRENNKRNAAKATADKTGGNRS